MALPSTSEEDKSRKEERKQCRRCDALYLDEDNSTTTYAFHGHITGDLDGEWSDKSGVTVYRWNERGSRPNTGRANCKERWSCCQERDEQAPPCRRGCHVLYDDGFTLF